MDVIWPWIAVALTLIVLSRAFGNNPVFRFSQYLFVGLSLGYTATVIVSNVLVSRVSDAVSDRDPVGFAALAVPIILGLMLWTRLGGQQVSWLANIPLALLFGVGAALALVGTLAGTLLPQLQASIFSYNQMVSEPTSVTIGRIVLLIGVILVLLSFRFTRPADKEPSPLNKGIARIGHWWLIVSIGIVFAGALITYQTALIDRIQFVMQQVGLG